MRGLRITLLTSLAVASALAVACSDSTSPGLSSGDGLVVVRLTDAPFPTNEVTSVDIFVVRVEARSASATDAEADDKPDDGKAGGWKTLASPNASYNLLALRNGATATLGSAGLTAGTYAGLRFIIDPSKSSVTLKNGKKLTNTSSPSVTFPSASRSGIKVNLSKALTISGGATTNLLIDFDLDESFVMRGNTVEQNGLLFKPVVKASVTDAATVNATLRLANATGSALDLLKGTTVVTGASNLAFGTSSACTSVDAATPGLTIATTGTTTALPGFAPTLAVGTSYTVVAYPNASNVVQFATLSNSFTPTAGQAGLRVFNATTGATGYDVFVTVSGAALTTPTFANVLTAGSSAFVSVPAGSSQIRITSTGLTTPLLLDLPSQTLTAGQNATLVIAPPATGSTTIRAFLVPGC